MAALLAARGSAQPCQNQADCKGRALRTALRQEARSFVARVSREAVCDGCMADRWAWLQGHMPIKKVASLPVRRPCAGRANAVFAVSRSWRLA